MMEPVENKVHEGENRVGENSPLQEIKRKEIMATQVSGKVKWFNVDLGYGFIHRDDKDEDIFVHHTEIVKYNPKHQLSSLADGELVEFDVVKGKKGLEASNVAGPDGKQVKGSRYATNLYIGRFRQQAWNYNGGYGGGYYGGNGRYYNRRRYHDDQPPRKSISDDQKAAKDEENVDEAKKNNVVRSRKYSKNRKAYAGEDGVRMRSSSLPSDFGRPQDNFQGGMRRRRGGGRGPVSGRPYFRSVYSGGQRRTRGGSNKVHVNADGQEIPVENRQNDRGNIPVSNEKEGSGAVGKKQSQHESADEKSEGKRVPSEGKDRSQKSYRKWRKNRHPNGNSKKSEKSVESSEKSQGGDKTGEKSERSVATDDGSKPNENVGDGKKDQGIQAGGQGKKRSYKRNRKNRNKRPDGRQGERSSSTEQSSAQASSAREENPKSEAEQCVTNHAGNGDGGAVNSGSGDPTVDHQAAEIPNGEKETVVG